MAVSQKKGQILFDTDEHPRETSMEKLAALAPVFKKMERSPPGLLPAETMEPPDPFDDRAESQRTRLQAIAAG